MLTVFYDNRDTNIREAWQNGEKVCSWNYREVAVMAAEKHSTVPHFGHYPNPPKAAEIGKREGEKK